jgi:uncharacterized protein with HEPN domain
MPRSALAYLADIIDACDGIALALDGVDLARYQANRVIRSAVEREFITIGEAANSLTRLDPTLVAGISHAGKIVAFRNRLTHDYAAIEDELVWAIAYRDVPLLRGECSVLLKARGERPEVG